MRPRATLLTLILVAGSFVLPQFAHAAIPFFGPVVPQTGGQAVCPASWGMLITVINNIIQLLITLAIVFVAPLMVAYSGFLFVVNPADSGGISKAKGILTNTIVGIVISLSAWMIVDAVMAVLYQSPNGAWGTWSSLIVGKSGDLCLPQAGALPTGTLNQAAPSVATGATAVAALPFGTGACDPSVLTTSGNQAGLNLSTPQANTFACLAKPESACGTIMQNYSWNKNTGNGKASTAFGAFQVTLSGNHTCFENTACYTAAGVTGPLNCQKGFGPNGFTAGGDPAILAACTKAAANLACNLAAAVCVQQAQGFSAWTGDPSGATVQKQCIAQYGAGL